MKGTRYGSYIVNGALGEGGLASVYRATDTRNGDEVALKVLSRDRRADTPGLRDRLHREADVLRALEHIPAVVNMLDVFRDDDTEADVLVLEYVRGQTLSSRFLQDRPPIDTVVEWMGHVCHAMHDIHQAGYVHRDIKPDNLLLTDDAALPMRIIDFNSAGKASTNTGRLTRVQGAFPHTPAYLPPECFDGVPPDASADVYALGMTFAELLIGVHPLLPDEDDTTTHSMWKAAQAETPFPHLPDLNDQIPEVLHQVLARATAKERSERIPDAVVLWQELKRVWDSMRAPPSIAAPPPVPRQGPINAALLTLGLVSSVGFAAMTGLWVAAASARDQSVSEVEQLTRKLAEKPPVGTAPAPKPLIGSALQPLSTLIPSKQTPKPTLFDTMMQEVSSKNDITKGVGVPAKTGSRVRVQLTMRRPDGSKLGAPTTHSITLGEGKLFKGIEAGIIGMAPGGVRSISIPPPPGYDTRLLAEVRYEASLSPRIDALR